MDFKKLLENRNAMVAIVIAVVLVLTFSIVISSKNSTGSKVEKEKVYTEPVDLLTTDNIGKALEIQALLAKEGIDAERVSDGTSKSTIRLKEYTMSQRDRALLAIVQSGLVDQNIGLEIFDKGDFTSTKDDKRIRLARAINGELSRLIRKIPPIENASVFISIPEPSIFTSMQKPTTATVQITIPVGERLPKDKVRAITNLLMGSVQGLEAKHITISDTNGNVYSSIIGAEDDMMDMLQENDDYMKLKVQAQLDKLVGAGNYVVTVSTFLRQVPIEKSSIVYDKNNASVLSAQKFTERLGDKSADSGAASSAVSTYLPGGMPQSASSSQNKNYNRSAEELEYGVSKTQVSEYQKEGMIEDISIAITVDSAAMPTQMTMEELKSLVARAASPKVNTDNVQIAFSDSVSPVLASERPVKLPQPESSGNPWWTVAVLLMGGLIAGLIVIANKVKDSGQRQENELRTLREKTSYQENKLNEVNQRASLIMAQQEQMQQSITTNKAIPLESNLQETISHLAENVDSADDISLQVKHWIENSN